MVTWSPESVNSSEGDRFGGFPPKQLARKSLMLTTAYVSPSHLPETAPSALVAFPAGEVPPSCPDDNRVRILVYGSAEAIEATIAQLHQLRFVEQFRWNPIRPMPENGIHIPPEHAAYSFLLKAVR